MSLSNLNNQHFSEEKWTAVLTAMAALETALSELSVKLSAEDRKRYGRVNEQNKLLVNKVYDWSRSQPNLRAQDVDWAEFDRDYKSRQNLEALTMRLQTVLERIKDAKTLHDYDNYQDALLDYAYTAYKAGGSAAGFEHKRNELKQFFARTKGPKKENTPPA